MGCPMFLGFRRPSSWLCLSPRSGVFKNVPFPGILEQKRWEPGSVEIPWDFSDRLWPVSILKGKGNRQTARWWARPRKGTQEEIVPATGCRSMWSHPPTGPDFPSFSSFATQPLMPELVSPQSSPWQWVSSVQGRSKSVTSELCVWSV